MENQNVKRFCQSCGMPLQNEAEMIDFCIRFEQQQNPGLDAEDARRAMRAWYPTLKRWKQAQG